VGFHRRHIDNNQIITLFREGGIDRVKEWYTKGADALVLEEGLASEIDDILGLVNVDITEKWNIVTKMILIEDKNESIKTKSK
jgi:hypothetical protein